MGMATITPESVLYCTQHPSPFSSLDRAYARQVLEMRKVGKLDEQHPSEKNLKVKPNTKERGSHKKPFYQGGRW